MKSVSKFVNISLLLVGMLALNTHQVWAQINKPPDDEDDGSCEPCKVTGVPDFKFSGEATATGKRVPLQSQTFTCTFPAASSTEGSSKCGDDGKDEPFEGTVSPSDATSFPVTVPWNDTRTISRAYALTYTDPCTGESVTKTRILSLELDNKKKPGVGSNGGGTHWDPGGGGDDDDEAEIPNPSCPLTGGGGIAVSDWRNLVESSGDLVESCGNYEHFPQNAHLEDLPPDPEQIILVGEEHYASMQGRVGYWEEEPEDSEDPNAKHPMHYLTKKVYTVDADCKTAIQSSTICKKTGGRLRPEGEILIPRTDRIIELEDEYTFEEFKSVGLASMGSFEDVFYSSNPTAELTYSEDESGMNYRKIQYKFLRPPGASGPVQINWVEIYYPVDHDPADNSSPRPQYTFRQATVTGAQSATYVIDPGNNPNKEGYWLVKLMSVELRVRQDIVLGPHGSAPMYLTPTPNDGSAVGELFSLWPTEEAYVTLGGTLADLIQAGNLPADHVKWSAPGIANRTNEKEYKVQWSDSGLKEVKLEIEGQVFLVRFNVPDTGTIDFKRDPLKDGPLISVIGVDAYGIIVLAGYEIQNRVANRYAQSGSTGGTRQDAIRHSSWNAYGAWQVGRDNMIIFSTANEYHGRYSAAGFASNTTMDLHNNNHGATTGGLYMGLPIGSAEGWIDTMEQEYNQGKLWIWVPPDANVNNHTHILRKSSGAQIFTQ